MKNGLFKRRKQKPSVKIDTGIYELIKKEAGLLNKGRYGKVAIGELVGLILETYLCNKDAFRDLTGDVIGTQPDWEVEEQDTRPPKTKIRSFQTDLFTSPDESIK